MGLREFVVRRAIESIILLILATALNFFIFRMMPGDPFAMFIENPNFKPETKKLLIQRFGLDKPLWEQFLIYFKNMFSGYYGISFRYLQPVSELIFSIRLVNTVVLMLSSTLFAVLFGVIFGVISAWRRGTKIDISSLVISLILYSMPVFWLGLLIILVFAYYLGIFPFGGTISRGVHHVNLLHYISDYVWHLIPPMTTLTLINLGSYLLIVRNTMLDVLTQDYMLTAKAVGLDNRTILFSYAMRNAMLPLVTIVALNLAFVMSGAVLTETVFSWYGMGRLIYASVMERDYPVLEATFWFISVMVILANLISDIIYAYLDPRIRY